MPENEFITETLRRLAALEETVDELRSQKQRYEILNRSVPAQIASNQNDYDPGDYDLVFLFSDASRNISGFSGGVNGRRLLIAVYGANDIVLLHSSGLSSVGNRLMLPGSASVTLSPNEGIYLVYSSPVWRVISYT